MKTHRLEDGVIGNRRRGRPPKVGRTMLQERQRRGQIGIDQMLFRVSRSQTESQREII